VFGLVQGNEWGGTGFALYRRPFLFEELEKGLAEHFIVINQKEVISPFCR
jgi:hypothetical protein